MCGIYGVLSKSRRLEQIEVELVNDNFMKEMSHRGPDQNGFYVSPDNRLLMGHLRLSIIDLKSGNQPMTDYSNANCIAFNGEIYNFIDLKEKSSYPFITQSDTEVILAKYSELGIESFDLLNGMYGISIFEQKNNLLRLCVDPLGIKSIYVYEDSDFLAYSSELIPLCSTLKKCFGINLEHNLEATDKFLYHGMYLNSQTPVNNIKKLLPGTILSIDVDKNSSDINRINYKSSISSTTTLDTVLEQSIKRQLVSDVPISLFLSGGIDSSILAVQLSKHDIDTTAYIFSFSDDKEIDESSYAIELASSLGMKYELVELTRQELQESFLCALNSMDEPISDFATIPLLELARVASLRYKVCLLGDGGDELFYGYTHHKFWKAKQLFDKSIFKVLGVNSFLNRVSYLLEFSSSKLVRKIALFLKISNPKSVSYGPFSNCQHLLGRPIESLETLGGIESLLKWEKENLLNRKMLQKTDRITMRYSMEARVPLLDLELVEFVKSFDINDCIVSGKGKYPLRKFLSKYLDESITKRKKQGFRTPADDWLRENLGNEIKLKMLACPHVLKFISNSKLSKLFEEHRLHKIDHSSRILSLFAVTNFWTKVDNAKYLKEDIEK